MTNLEIVQGDEKPYNLTFVDGSGDALDITGATVTMTIKRSLGDEDATLTKPVTSHTDAENGLTTITLSESDTNQPLGAYYYDIEISGGSISKTTVLKGKLTLTWQTTGA